MPFLRTTLLFTAIFLFSLGKPVAGQSKTDSLIAVLKTQKEDTNAVKTIHRICVAYVEENNPEGSLAYAKTGIAMAERLKLGKPKINQYYHAGKACIILSRYDDAFNYLDYAIKHGKEYKKLYPQCLSAMGTVFIKQGNYPKAMDYLLESLKIKEEMTF